MSAWSSLAKSPATAYAFLGVVVVVGFVVVHSALKSDITDVAGVVKHPFGQAFDDWFNNLIGGPTTDTADNADVPPTTFPVDPDFGLKNPAQGF